MKRSRVLARSFYARSDPVAVARGLLGKILRVQRGGGAGCAVRIVETEAYGGDRDRASHAWRGKTMRNASMFGRPGTAYVYLCYGIHRMFNVVTSPQGVAAAVLIRAGEPIEGKEGMARKRGVRIGDVRGTAGPGALTQAMGISLSGDGCDLVRGRIRLEDDGMRVASYQISKGRRIGVSAAGVAGRFLWRFWIAGHPCVSRARA